MLTLIILKFFPSLCKEVPHSKIFFPLLFLLFLLFLLLSLLSVHPSLRSLYQIVLRYLSEMVVTGVAPGGIHSVNLENLQNWSTSLCSDCAVELLYIDIFQASCSVIVKMLCMYFLAYLSPVQ